MSGLKIAISVLAWILILTPILISFHVFKYTDPASWPDEAVFSDVALHWIKTGQMTTTIYGKLLPTLSEHVFFYPPLYFVALGLWLQFTGLSLFTVRSLSLLFIVMAIVVFVWIFQKQYRSWKLAYIGALFLSSDYFVGRAARSGRMESLVFLLLALAWYCQTVLTSKPVTKTVLVSVLCALALLTHPMGVIVPIISCLLLIQTQTSWRHRIVNAVVIWISTTGGILIWIVANASSIPLFVHIFSLRAMQGSTYVPYVQGLIHAPGVWRFWVLSELSILIVYLIILRRKTHSWYWIPPLGLGVAIIGNYIGGIMFYMIYLQPLLTLLSLSLVQKAQQHTLPSITKKGIVFIALAPLIANAAIFIYKQQSLQNKNYETHTNAIRSSLEFATTTCWSTLPDPYFKINNQTTTRILMRMAKTPDDLIAFLDDCDIYIANYYPDAYVQSYVTQNTMSLTPISSGGYETMIYKLKPKSHRVHPDIKSLRYY